MTPLNKIFAKSAFILTVLVLAACKSDDTDFSAIINGGNKPEIPEESIARGLEFDDSPLEEPVETVPAEDNDYLENWTEHYLVEIEYKGESATVAGNHGDCLIAAKGAHVMAELGKDNIHFRLKGQSPNGSLKVYGDHRFMVSLADLKLTNPTGAVVNSQCGKTLYLVTEKGCAASLSDGPDYLMSEGEDMKGCIFSEGQIVFSGEGELIVDGKAKNAIASDDYIVTRPGCKLKVTSTGSNGIKANDAVTVRGGCINIFTSAVASKGINCEGDLNIDGGRIVILNSGGTRIEGIDATSAAALKCDGTFTMTAGQLFTESTGDGGKGINSDMGVLLKGGQLQIATFGEKFAYGDGLSSSPRCIKTDTKIEIDGASLRAYATSCKPLKAATAEDITVSPSQSVRQTDRYFEVK